jgi:hypothetical protein
MLGRSVMTHYLVAGDEVLAGRLQRLREISRKVRASEYHVTTACNIRCRGCWFFEYKYENQSRDQTSIAAWQDFVKQQVDAGITAALLIGGEPTLFLDRIEAFVQGMEYVTVSTNGLDPLPMSGFEKVAVAITLFAGGELDDHLRGIKPNGRTFSGLFETSLYAVSAEGLDLIEETVQSIEDNGNQVTFNYYSAYGSEDPLARVDEEKLLNEALRVKSRHPETVVCDDYYIRALITGKTEFGAFGHDVCPSVSVGHPDQEGRLKNGNPFLPRFNTYASDLKTINFCCTSGHCEACRDSQAVFSWLLVSFPKFLGSPEQLRTWVDMAESYWRQFVWSPYHRSSARAT